MKTCTKNDGFCQVLLNGHHIYIPIVLETTHRYFLSKPRKRFCIQETTKYRVPTSKAETFFFTAFERLLFKYFSEVS